MKRIVMLALVAVGALAYGVGVASADSPHFVSASGSVNSSGALVVSWHEAGLGNGQTIDYTATADASAVYGCCRTLPLAPATSPAPPGRRAASSA